MDRIIYSTPDGGVVIVIPANSVSEALKDVPADIEYEIVPSDHIPSDRFFRNAWKANGKRIEVDLPKAKTIAHDIRRQKRDEEFRPHDDLIIKQIPGTDVAAVEAQRQRIRDKYAQMQVVIDAATTAEAIKAALLAS